MPRATDTRERVITAAEDIVIRDGVSRLTLEAAAHEAAVSKGGVLYHFPSRAALVTAMVERFVAVFDADLERYGARGGRPGDFVLAYLEASLSPSYTSEHREQRLGAGLLAGMASDPELLAPLRARFVAWQAAAVADGLDPAVATLVRLAVDGLWLCDVFELAPLGDRLRDAVAEEIRRLAGRR